MNQYELLGKRILDEGTMVYNERTGKGTLTVINADMKYDVGAGEFPLVTTRKCYWKAAIAELLGYIRGHGDAADFRRLGTTTWDANANDNIPWLANPFRDGVDDMGQVYGVIGRGYTNTQYLQATSPEQYRFLADRGYDMLDEDGEGSGEIWQQSIDQFYKVYSNLKDGIDDRGEIITFWNPAEFDFGCLRPCMHTHTFSLLGDTLHLTSYQRSCDVPLGLTFNQVQCYALLALMAQITGHKAGTAYHKVVNAHIYEDQIPLFKEQMMREPFKQPTLKINPKIQSLNDLETWVTVDDFELVGYEHHEPIKFPFSV